MNYLLAGTPFHRYWDYTFCCPSESVLAPAPSNRDSTLTSWGPCRTVHTHGYPSILLKNGRGYFISEALCDLDPHCSIVIMNCELGTVSDHPRPWWRGYFRVGSSAGPCRIIHAHGGVDISVSDRPRMAWIFHVLNCELGTVSDHPRPWRRGYFRVGSSTHMAAWIFHVHWEFWSKRPHGDL
jgi:hypothetical protein